jgi:hypothetical protein
MAYRVLSSLEGLDDEPRRGEAVDIALSTLSSGSRAVALCRPTATSYPMEKQTEKISTFGDHALSE